MMFFRGSRQEKKEMSMPHCLLADLKTSDSLVRKYKVSDGSAHKG